MVIGMTIKLTKAAKDLEVSQITISRRIKTNKQGYKWTK